MKEYKIDFGLGFLLCILMMVFNEVWTILGNLPEAFPYGDFIYHIIVGVVAIINNLAIGIAAAIIFYYAVQFIDKKKNYEIYTI